MTDVSVGADAPVVPVSTDTPAPESTADQAVATPEGEPPKPTRPTFDDAQQKEVDRIVEKVRKNESKRAERVARAEARAEFAEQQLAARDRPAQTAKPAGAPDPKDYQDFEKYQADLIDWKVEQKLAGFKQESQAQQEARAAQARAQTVTESLKPAMTKYPDFREVALSEDVPITAPMAAAIAKSKQGGDIAYHLGSNLEEAHRIAQLDPVEQVWAIKDLESKLSAAPAPTRTPAPIVPNTSNAKVTRDIDQKLKEATDYDDFSALRRAQQKAKGRR